MSDKKVTKKIVLEIEWTSVDNFDDPKYWDWRRVKSVMTIDKIKYIGEYTENKDTE